VTAHASHITSRITSHATPHFTHPCASASSPIKGNLSLGGYVKEHGRVQPCAPARGSSSFRSGPGEGGGGRVETDIECVRGGRGGGGLNNRSRGLDHTRQRSTCAMCDV
jgi:hypothetical protein